MFVPVISTKHRNEAFQFHNVKLCFSDMISFKALDGQEKGIVIKTQSATDVLHFVSCSYTGFPLHSL